MPWLGWGIARWVFVVCLGSLVKCLTRWSKGPLEIWQHSCTGLGSLPVYLLINSTSGISWHPRPAGCPQGCRSCLQCCHCAAPRAPGPPPLGAAGGPGSVGEPGSTDTPARFVLSSLMARLPSRSWGYSGMLRDPLSPAGLPGPPRRTRGAGRRAPLRGVGHSVLPDTQFCSPCSSPDTLPG